MNGNLEARRSRRRSEGFADFKNENVYKVGKPTSGFRPGRRGGRLLGPGALKESPTSFAGELAHMISLDKGNIVNDHDRVLYRCNVEIVRTFQSAGKSHLQGARLGAATGGCSHAQCCEWILSPTLMNGCAFHLPLLGA